MKTTRLTDRVGAVESVGVGSLRDHCLVFNRRGSYHPGGVASIRRRPSSTVYGVVWKLAEKEFETLDRIEDSTAYSRVTIEVELLGNDTISCHTYVAFPEGYFAPSADYLSIIIQGAMEHDLPISYVRALKRRRTMQL